MRKKRRSGTEQLRLNEQRKYYLGARRKLLVRRISKERKNTGGKLIGKSMVKEDGEKGWGGGRGR